MSGFNGAAGVNPRMEDGDETRPGKETELQWGRGCEPTDGHCVKQTFFLILIASMGPRV